MTDSDLKLLAEIEGRSADVIARAVEWRDHATPSLTRNDISEAFKDRQHSAGLGEAQEEGQKDYDGMREFQAKFIAADSRREALERLLKVRTEALSDAIDEVEGWGAYASEYFQDKHDLAGTIARLRAALSQGTGGT